MYEAQRQEDERLQEDNPEALTLKSHSSDRLSPEIISYVITENSEQLYPVIKIFALVINPAFEKIHVFLKGSGTSSTDIIDIIDIITIAIIQNTVHPFRP